MNPDNKTLTETQIQEAVHNDGSKKNIILDSQLLSSLMECGRLFDFKFNHNFQSIGGKSNSLECGSAIHKFMEVFQLSKLRGASRDQAIGFGMAATELYIHGCSVCTNFIPQFCEQHPNGPPDSQCPNCILTPRCGHSINEYEGMKNTPPDSEGYKIGWKFVIQTIEQYLEYYKNDPWITLEVECVKSKLLYEDDEIRILWKAKLDSIVDTNHGIFPRDYKTMKQNRQSTSLNNQFMGQCFVTSSKAILIDKIGFQKSLEPKDKFVRAIINYSNERLLEWQSITVPYWAKTLLMYAESGYWPERYSACDGKYGPCSFKSVCESDPNMREEEIRNNFIVGKPWNIKSADGSDD